MSLSFLTENGRFLARVQGPVSGNVLLRREQYRRADDPIFSAEVATACVVGKIANCRTVLLRGLRDHADKIDAPVLEEAVHRLAAALRQLQGKLGLDAVRGVEGDAARVYFNAFDHLIVRGKDDFFHAPAQPQTAARPHQLPALLPLHPDDERYSRRARIGGA